MTDTATIDPTGRYRYDLTRTLGESSRTVWPEVVGAADWCGEYEEGAV